jgi:hypothetical protein
MMLFPVFSPLFLNFPEGIFHIANGFKGNKDSGKKDV